MLYTSSSILPRLGKMLKQLAIVLDQQFLVSIQSSAEAARVSHFLPSTTKDIWTGGFRARGGKRPWNGMWTWTDGSAFKYTNWGRGEPNYNLGVEYYIQISDVGRKNYWNDFPDRNRLPFVCKCRLQ